MNFYVYILTNYTNTVLYIGVTNHLIRRVYEHKQKFVSSFTSKYKINKLVYYEIFDDIKTAIEREKKLKNLVRRKKIDLISKMNSKWQDLYYEIIK